MLLFQSNSHVAAAKLSPVGRPEMAGMKSTGTQLRAVLGDRYRVIVFASALGKAIDDPAIGSIDRAFVAAGVSAALLDIRTAPSWWNTPQTLAHGGVRVNAVIPRTLWQEHADVLVESLVRKGRFDAVKDLAEVFPMRVFPDLIGLPVEGREKLLPYAAATFDAFGPRNAVFDRSAGRIGDAADWVARACRRENLSDGGWGIQVYRAADEGRCTPEEAERLVRSFLTAGLDTTINGIAHLILAFTRFPDQWALLRERPELIKRALDEWLR